jgi:hypothetical protein
MWMGARSVEGELPLHSVPKWVIWIAGGVCLFFVGVRHAWLGARLTQEHLGLLLDKWQLGPLRVLNIIAFVCVLYSLRGAVRWVISREPFITLGRASIEVFCAHLLFVFVGLALLYGEVPQLHGIYALSLLIVTFIGLLYVAQRQVRRKHAEKARSTRAPAPIANTAA